jgi:hypothetical protein
VKGNDTAYVSSDRDREVVVVDVSSPTAGHLIRRIKLDGNALGMTIDQSQSRLYVAQDNADQVAVIDTLTNAVIGKSVKEEQKPAYHGITITRLSYTRDVFLGDFLNRSAYVKERPFVPMLHHAKVKGAWYISTQESALKRTIDLVLDSAESKKVDVNSSLHLSPRAATLAGETLRDTLERETHKQTLAVESLWLALYGSGVLPHDASPKEAARTARKFLGFVPVSPDGSAYRFDRRTAEVINARHGSLSQPRLNSTLAADMLP